MGQGIGAGHTPAVGACPEAVVDAFLASVQDGLDGLSLPWLDELSPSAPEAVMALLGRASELRPGRWAELGSALRSSMLRADGARCGSC